MNYGQFRFGIAGLLLLTASVIADPIRIGSPLSRHAMTTPQTTSPALDTLRERGSTLVRIPVDWSRIEPQKDAWQFSELDTAVRAAYERQLQVMLVFGPAPAWAITYLGPNPSRDEVCRAKPDLDAYRKFVEKTVDRYREQVDLYQVWERPSSRTLLAPAHEIIALYRTGVSAVHATDPGSQAIVTETGDANLAWIADYLHAATESERADIISIAPLRPSLTSMSFYWRLQLLRQRVLPKDAPPTLWLELTVGHLNLSKSLSWASMAFMQGITHVLLLPTDEQTASQTAFIQANRFLSSLQGLEFQGTLQKAPNLIGAYFTGDIPRMLLLPFVDGTVDISPSSVQPSSEELTATGDAVGITTHLVQESILQVNEPKTLPLQTLVPVILRSVTAEVTPGNPDLHPLPIRSAVVVLDQAAKDPSGIQALPYMPGGHYARYTLPEGRTMLVTARNTDPWIYFDIPDGFLFYNTERVPVEITVRVFGAAKNGKVGFQLYYDAIRGMRTSSWQWIDEGVNDIYTYKVILYDGLFSGREGYDLRLDMGGSDESVRLYDISVRKLFPSPAPTSGNR